MRHCNRAYTVTKHYHYSFVTECCYALELFELLMTNSNRTGTLLLKHFATATETAHVMTLIFCSLATFVPERLFKSILLYVVILFLLTRTTVCLLSMLYASLRTRPIVVYVGILQSEASNTTEQCTEFTLRNNI